MKKSEASWQLAATKTPIIIIIKIKIWLGVFNSLKSLKGGWSSGSFDTAIPNHSSPHPEPRPRAQGPPRLTPHEIGLIVLQIKLA